MLFELKYKYHSLIFYKKNVDPYFKSKVANKLTKKLGNFIVIYRKNL